MIRLAIVDDEDLFAQQLTEYLTRLSGETGYEFSISQYRDGDEIASSYQGDLDVILMDIQMRFMNGMAAAEEIRKRDRDVVIMFITNMTGYAIQGYQVDALDYILKPVEYFAFCQKLLRAIERIKRRSPEYHVLIRVEDGSVRLSVRDIYYIECQGHYVIYHSSEGEFRTRDTMQELEESLKTHDFFRCGKGFLVNMQHVAGVRDGDCIIKGQRIPISRMRKKEFLSVLNRYINEVV